MRSTIVEREEQNVYQYMHLSEEAIVELNSNCLFHLILIIVRQCLVFHSTPVRSPSGSLPHSHSFDGHHSSHFSGGFKLKRSGGDYFWTPNNLILVVD